MFRHLAYSCSYHTEQSTTAYKALLEEVLQDGTVDDGGRAKLRAHRVANSVDQLHHVNLLIGAGWTLDDLEEGRKIKRPLVDVASAGTKTPE